LTPLWGTLELMPRRRRRLFATALLALLSCAVAALLAAAPLTVEQQRGRQIYLEGSSPSGGEITAVMGEEGVEVPASADWAGEVRERYAGARERVYG